MNSPPARRRVAVSLLIGAAAAAYVGLVALLQPAGASPDCDQWWVAARAWRLGLDPYAVVPAAGWRWPLLYPGPMILAWAPLASLSVVAARVVAMGVGAALLAWVIQATGRSLWLLASGAFIATLYVGQAGAWLVAAAGVPWLGFVLVCKPTLGLAVGLPYLRPAHIVSAGIMVAASLILIPSWPREWWQAIHQAPDVVAPLTRPGGFVLLAALLRWRNRDAWLVLAMACVPHTTLIHETLPLALIPRGTRQSQLFAATTLAAAALLRWAPAASWSVELGWNWPFVLVGGYLPALLMLFAHPVSPSGPPSRTWPPSFSIDAASLRACLAWLRLNWQVVAIVACLLGLYALVFTHDASGWHPPAFHLP